MFRNDLDLPNRSFRLKARSVDVEVLFVEQCLLAFLLYRTKYRQSDLAIIEQNERILLENDRETLILFYVLRRILSFSLHLRTIQQPEIGCICLLDFATRLLRALTVKLLVCGTRLVEVSVQNRVFNRRSNDDIFSVSWPHLFIARLRRLRLLVSLLRLRLLRCTFYFLIDGVS
jgi:hypothetical protein